MQYQAKPADKPALQSQRCAIYARTSRDDPEDPRLSTSSQVLEAEKRIADLGGTLDRKYIYIDVGISGSRPPTRWLHQKTKSNKANHRPELEKLMSAIDRRDVDAVVCFRRDRLFRNLEMALRFYRFL